MNAVVVRGAWEFMNLRHAGRIVPVLTNVVDDSAGIDALHPRARWAVIEQTGVKTVMGKGAASICALEAATELANRSPPLTGWHAHRWRQKLNIHVGQICFVPSRSKRSPIPMAETCGIEYLHHFEVPRT